MPIETSWQGATLGANTFTGAQGLPAGSAAAPSLYFGGDTTTGLYRGAANIIRIATSGTDRLAFYSEGIALGSTGLYAFSSGAVGTSVDTVIARGSAAAFILRNNADTAGITLDVATDATAKFRNRANNAGAIMDGLQLNLTDGITAPSATVGIAKIFVDTADGDLKVIFGDGITKVLAADT